MGKLTFRGDFILVQEMVTMVSYALSTEINMMHSYSLEKLLMALG
jgi:hypothetical protein